MHNCFVAFNPESLQLSKKKSAKSHFENVKYSFVHCLNRYRKHSLYFKSKTRGYALLFDDAAADKGHTCYKNLLVMQDRNAFTKRTLTTGSLTRFDRVHVEPLLLFRAG